MSGVCRGHGIDIVHVHVRDFSIHAVIMFVYTVPAAALISLTFFPSSTIIAGDNVTLICSVTLPPGVTGTPDIQWEGPGVTPTPADPTTNGQEVSSVLTLSSISTSQAGQYTCTATLTGATPVMASVNITVKSKTILVCFMSECICFCILQYSPLTTVLYSAQLCRRCSSRTNHSRRVLCWNR